MSIDNTRQARVSLYMTDDAPSYPATVSDERWNGFEMPRFDLATAHQIAADLAKTAETDDYMEVPVWDEALQGFLLVSALYDIGDAEFISADEDGLYDIGAGFWTWQLVEDETEEDA